MKTKKSIMLSAVAMLVFSGAAMGTGTFAWFTNIRQATIDFDNVEIIAAGGDLQVAYANYGSATYAAASDSSEGGLNITATEANKAADISGDGLNFYRPIFVPGSSTVASSIATIASDSGYYVQFKLTISRSDTGNTGATDGFKVYLGANTKTVGKSAATEDVAAAAASRVAILGVNGTGVPETVIFQHAYESGDAAYQHLATASPGTEAYSVDGFELKANTVYDAAAGTGTFLSGALVNRTKNAADATHTTVAGSSPVIADLTGANVTKTIVVRIWLEGTDPEGTSAAAMGNMVTTLDFYALDMKI